MPSLPVPAAEAARQRQKRQRLRRRVLISVWVVPIVLLVIALYFAFGPQPPSAPVPLPVSPQETAVATQHINSVQQALTQPAPTPPPALKSSIKSVKKSVKYSPDETTTLRVSQADLNTYISGNAKFHASLEAKGVHAATVILMPPDNLTIHAAATFRGISGNALITGTLAPDPQTVLKLQITHAQFGRFPPPVVRAAASAIIAHLLGRTHTKLPVTINSVNVTGSDLVITETHTAGNSFSTPNASLLGVTQLLPG
jgi:hypothetical protein